MTILVLDSYTHSMFKLPQEHSVRESYRYFSNYGKNFLKDYSAANILDLEYRVKVFSSANVRTFEKEDLWI